MRIRTLIAFTSLLSVLYLISCPAHSSESAIPVARIGKQVITLSELDREGEDAIWDARIELYELRKETLTDMVDGKLLEWEANSRGIDRRSLELKEINSKISPANYHLISVVLLLFTKMGVIEEGMLNDKESRDEIGNELLPEILVQLRRRDFIRQLRTKYNVDYLLEEPVLEYKRYSLNGIDGDLVGNENAPVTVTYLYSVTCAICAQAEEELVSIMSQYPDQVRLIIINPFLSFDDDEVAADRASRCANKQGRFWDYHKALFGLLGSEDDYSEKTLLKVATDTGLDIQGFTSCLSREASPDVPTDDYNTLESRLNLEGTPTFFVNGIKLVGLPAVYELGKLIQAELEQGKEDRDTSSLPEGHNGDG